MRKRLGLRTKSSKYSKTLERALSTQPLRDGFIMSAKSQRSNYRPKTTMSARTFCGTSTDSAMFAFPCLRFLKIVGLL